MWSYIEQPVPTLWRSSFHGKCDSMMVPAKVVECGKQALAVTLFGTQIWRQVGNITEAGWYLLMPPLNLGFHRKVHSWDWDDSSWLQSVELSISSFVRKGWNEELGSIVLFVMATSVFLLGRQPWKMWKSSWRSSNLESKGGLWHQVVLSPPVSQPCTRFDSLPKPSRTSFQMLLDLSATLWLQADYVDSCPFKTRQMTCWEAVVSCHKLPPGMTCLESSSELSVCVCHLIQHHIFFGFTCYQVV